MRTSFARRTLCTALAFAAALAGCAHTEGTRQEREEARLAKLLEGRVPGKPESCITALSDNRLQFYDRTAVVYDAGDTIWVSRPTDPRSLDTRDVVVIRRTGSQLCKQDIIRTVDRTSGITTGVVFLENFVPYRRP
jgi:hypothetical protein